MSWRPNVVRSLGLDQGHHEELRNGPEIKNHIRESLFLDFRKVRDFSGIVSEDSRRFRRVPLWGPPVPEGLPATKEWPTGPCGQPSLVHVANQWAAHKKGVTTFERRRLPLFKEKGGYHLGDEVVGCPKPPYIKRGRGLNVPS